MSSPTFDANFAAVVEAHVRRTYSDEQRRKMPFVMIGIAEDEDAGGQFEFDLVRPAERVAVRPTTLARLREVAGDSNLSLNNAISMLLDLLPPRRRLVQHASKV